MTEKRAQILKEYLDMPLEIKNLIESPEEIKNQLNSEFFKSKVFEIKGNNCENCDSCENLNIHHLSYHIHLPENIMKRNKLPKFQTYTNKTYYIDEDDKWKLIFEYHNEYFLKNLNNLQILCRECHNDEHQRLQKETGSFMPISLKTLEKFDKIQISDISLHSLPKTIEYVYNDHSFEKGRNKPLFLLLTFFVNISTNYDEISTLINKWNESQIKPLSKTYIEYQLNYFKNKKEKYICPSFKNKIYREIGIPEEVIKKDIYRFSSIRKKLNNNPVEIYDYHNKLKLKR